MRIRTGYVVVLILIVGAIAAAPYADGYYFKTHYINLINAQNAHNPSKIIISQYQLGWLSSEAKLTIKLQPKDATTTDAKAESHTITINQHIQHGPYFKVPATGLWQFDEAMVDSQIHIDKKMEDVLLKGITPNQGVMQVNTLVSFFGNYLSQIQTPAVNIILPSQAKITWEGLRGSVSSDFVNNVLTHIKSDLTGGAFSIVDKSGSMTIQGATGQGEKSCQQSSLCTGSAALGMQGISITLPDQSAKIASFNMTTNYGVNDKDAFNSDVKFALSKMDTPDYSINQASVHFSIANLNATQLQKFMDISASQHPSPDMDPRVQELAFVAAFGNVVPRLLMSNSIFNEDILIKTTYGDFSSKGKAYWPATTPLPTSMLDLPKINSEVTIRIATSLLDQIIAVLDAKQQAQQASQSAPALQPVTPAKPRDFDGVLNQLVTNGQLSVDEQTNLSALWQKMVSKQVFNSYVDSRVAIRAIPKNIAEQLKQEYVTATNAGMSGNDSSAGFNKQLDDWVSTNKMTKAMRTELVGLQKQHLSPEIYAASLDNFVAAHRLSADFAMQLKNQYEANNSDASLMATEASSGGASATPSAAPAAAPVGSVKLKWDNLIKQGLVIQDKDDYVINVVYKDGIVKINGIVIPLSGESAAPSVPTTPAAPLAAPTYPPGNTPTAPQLKP